MPRWGVLQVLARFAVGAGDEAQREKAGAQSSGSHGMTRYSRSVIPGRQQGDSASDVDRIVFGQKPAANDADGPSDISDNEVSTLVDRAITDRRKGGRRRQTDYAPLSENGGAYRPRSEGSKRGPLLLVGAMVIVAVFGVVVWNAYRDGVRPEDSLNAPQLAESGPFKTKPDTATATDSKFARPDYGATVFEQVEKPKATIQPAPETRAEAAPPPPAKVTPPAAKVTPPPAAPATPAPAAAAPKTTAPAPQPVTTTAAKPAAPVATPPKTITPVQTTAATPVKTAPVQAAPAQAVSTPAKPAAIAVAKAEAINLVPAAPAPAGAYTPAFASGGKYAVQVAAASDETGAKAEWDRRARSAPELFATAERFIVQADVNGRTVYRVRAGSFATSADADAFCNAYKAKGGQCFRVAK